MSENSKCVVCGSVMPCKNARQPYLFNDEREWLETVVRSALGEGQYYFHGDVEEAVNWREVADITERGMEDE